MNTSHPRAHCSPMGNSREHGVVLFIALIVMVAMSLAAIALMRSVDTTSAVIGNLSFRQASILPANYGIEDAAAGLFSDVNPANVARIPDVRLDTPAENYYATHSQAAGWDDPYGVPQPLQAQPPPTWPRAKTDTAQNTITYVIERMCNPNAPPKQSPGTTINDPMAAIIAAQPFYRVTVRVDGPPGTHTVSFAQAMLR